MTTLILEQSDYSPRALEIYGRLGPLWMGEPPQGMTSSVSLLVVRLAHKLDYQFLSKYPKLIAIASPTTGLSHIDCNVCREKGIRVFSLQDCREAIENVTSTSELALGLMIALLRRIPQAHYDVTIHGRWDRDRFRSRQLAGLTLGIIGLGRIGGHVARYARAMGMQVIASDPYQSETRFADLAVQRRNLVSLLEEADIISLHTSLQEDTYNLLGAQEISLMCSGALLINTARGALLDETAVVSAVRNGKLGGVAVDVLADEQSSIPWNESPLVSAAQEGYNIILTPHIGGCTSDAMHITEESLAEVVANALEGLI
ncbi:MAG TPA: NAD(P)-dependent oxidoreductase [Candidatus Cloacimonadota bacterium]|nr:NAD(P)-dependent oxidoreductase [Syntrophorhabdus sp.]HQQ68195.1 NAD(P)-dependent oxidoreductase [Candidatus Cloacimonadota bacterium]